MDPLTLLALFGPAIKDGTMALIKKWTGSAAGQPSNTAELIQLMEAETKQLEARIKAGDTEGSTYPWVIAMIKLQRPLVVYSSFITFLFMSAYNLGSIDAQTMVGNLCSTVVFWLFGERYNMKTENK